MAAPAAARRSSTARRRNGAGSKKVKKLSRTRKPGDLSLEDWQRELRRQFGREQAFRVQNVGEQPVFSEFLVTNPSSRSTYRVAIRGAEAGENFCSCPDFSTNALGTCKHIEFTLAHLERKKGGKAALRAGFQPPYSQVFLQYGLSRCVRFKPGTECPGELARLAGSAFDDEGVLTPDGFARFDRFLSDAGRIDHELRCYDDALTFIAEVRDTRHRGDRIAAAFPKGIRSAAFKTLLKVPLYDYQREGALFAARAGRCLLGDEMGLGKTIQALAAAEIMARELGVERVLVICPTSLKHQWEHEIGRFTERTATVVGGQRFRRQEGYHSGTFFTITNYDTVHRDLDLIAELAPDLVILDEAQRIKNWETRLARSVKKIQTRYGVVLTGTPLENRLEELISIVQFVDQHRLGPTYKLLDAHQIKDEHGRVVGYRGLDRIGRTLAPILLRRQKNQVLEQLPERMDKHLFVPMTPQQTDYHEYNAEQVAKIVRKWRRMGFLTEADQRILMISLQNMRMSCDSTYLLDHETDHSVKPDEFAAVMDELLEQPRTKAVVFSQWTRMHELAIRRVEQRDWGHVFFHGGVAGTQRKQLVDQFREDPDCRLFLATDAGGVGLNLQHANVVVNLDLPWNPAVLEQRIGRAHRLGQTQPVQVINFVARGTIEEGMLSVLAFKKSLFAGVLDGGETEIFLGQSRLNKFMETVEKVTASIPAVPPEPLLPEEAEPAEEAALAEESPAAAPAPAVAGGAAVDPLAGLLQQGLSLLEQLAAGARQPRGGEPRHGEPRPTGLETIRDEATGRTYVKLALPEPEVLDRFLGAIGSLLEQFRK